LALEVCGPFQLLQFGSVRESGSESAARVLQQASGSVLPFEQSKTRALESGFVHAWRNELGVSVNGPKTDFLVGDGSGKDSGIGE
jgi:hypothetical protein